MEAIPDLAKKTSINSLLNPEASSSSSSSSSSSVGVPFAPLVGGHTDVYAAAAAAGQLESAFHLRTASWNTSTADDRRKEQHGRHHHQYGSEGMDMYRRGVEWQDYGTGMGSIAPMYSDERTALSGDYAHSNYTAGYAEQWQHSERASARLVARDSRFGYYEQHPQISFDQPQPPQPPLKRHSPADQPPPEPPKKRAKQTPAPSKRGYPTKKRNDAQLVAQNAKVMTHLSYTPKGKEKSNGVSMQIVPLGPNDHGQALHAEPQSTRCMSTKYKNDPFPRCVACTRRWAGDTCRFQGIRYFLRDSEMKIVGVTFSETQKADMPSMKFPKEWNEKLTPEHITRTKKTIAMALLPTLRQELTHLRQDTIIHRPREREVRATCDTCMTSLFSSSWLCRLCGREACGDCYATVCDLTLEKAGMSHAEMQALQGRRDKHTYANPFFLQCTKRVEHKAVDFSPMSRFCLSELEGAIKEMEGIVREEERAQAQVQAQMQMQAQMNGYSSYHMPMPMPMPTPAPSLPQPLPTAPYIPPNLSHKTLHIPTLPIPHYTSQSLTPTTFPALWARGEPLVVVGLLPRFKIQWTPEYFVEKYGAQSCLVIECQTEVNRRVTVGEFFRAFGRYKERGVGVGVGGESSSSSSSSSSVSPSSVPGATANADGSASASALDEPRLRNAPPSLGRGRTGEVWKLKDWPPSMDFKKAFPELWEDFGNAVPVPSYVRRDGVMNLASHFPEDTVAPDIGPKMYNAMATTQESGSKGSTRLHMDMADALNIMTYASPAPDGSAGCAAWDLFRAEDSDKIRAFLAEHAIAVAVARVGEGKDKDKDKEGGKDKEAGKDREAGREGGTTTARVDWTSNDPIHGQQFYLDEEMREKLYLTKGVRSYRFYQRPGEAVFIPAGCAHQVANLADCIKVAVDFVSPENVERCEKLTREFREQNQRKMWKEDVLQLRTMMWFAWLSCCQQRERERGQ